MALITYENKIALNEEPEIADINKVTDNDMNEIKNVVNENFNNSQGVVLYDNSTGTYTTATLNDNISNYSKIVITWVPNQYTNYIGRRTTIDYDFKPNVLYTMHTTFWASSNNQMYATATGYTINGNTLTISINQGGTVGASTAYGASPNVMKVVKVIGYK